MLTFGSGNSPKHGRAPDGARDTQMHERDALRALFSFGGSLADLDPTQVSNVPAAVANARAFAREVIALLRPAKAEAA